MNRNIIIVLIVVVLIALVGLIAFSYNTGPSDTQITFLTNSTLNSGDQLQFELKDAQGNALANENVSIRLEGNGEVQRFSVITDSEGKGGLLFNNSEYGSYNVTVSYGGGEKYNSCEATQSITIGGQTSQSSNSGSESYEQTASADSSSQSTSSDSSSNLNYDSDLNVYYDSNGKVVGGQNDGESYEYIKNNQPSVDEEGNLV